MPNMEYPPPTMGVGQPNYPQDQSRISPGYNSHPSSGVFPSSGASPHHRTYVPYSQTYQPPHEFSGPQPPHPTANPPHAYSPDGHGQGLTLNQLLQQGNSSGAYPIRPGVGPASQTPYRMFEQFPYGYRSGVPGTAADRPQGSAYHYASSMQSRYPDPYGRPAYAAYPGPPYPYYQNPSAPSLVQPHRQPAAPQSAIDYPPPNSTISSPGPSQLSNSAVSAPAVDRSPSAHVSIQGHSTSPSPVPQLSSPVHTCGAPGVPTPGWQLNVPPFGSPQQPNHGQAPMQPPARPRSTSRESQCLRVSADSSEPPSSNPSDKNSDSNTVLMTDETAPRSHPHLNEGGRLLSATNTGSGNESAEDHLMQLATVAEGVISTSTTGSLESSSPTSSFVSNSTLSPLQTTSRATPTVISSPSSNYPPGPHNSGSVLPLGMTQSRLHTQPNQPSRSYSVPQGSQVHRHLYSPYPSPQPHPSLMQPSGQCMPGFRPPAFYPSAGHSVRSMAHVSMHPSSVPSGIPRGPGAPSHFQQHSGASSTGMMPPPSAPPPSTGQPGLGSGSPLTQMGFISANSYASPSSTGGSAYVSSPASSVWDPHQNPSMHPSIAATTGAGQSQSYASGRSSAPFSSPSERGADYSSPHTNTSTTQAVLSAVMHPQTSLPASAYAHPPSVPSYHSPHMVSYQSGQSPYHSHSYLGVGPRSPTHAQQHVQQAGVPSVNWTGLPPPYHSSAITPVGVSNQSMRENFHPQYSQAMLHVSERGPSYCSPIDPAASSSSLPSVGRGPSVASTGAPKMAPCGAAVKVGKPGLGSSVPSNLGASLVDDSGAPMNHPQPSQSMSSVIPHANHGTMQHFTNSYWPDGAPSNQFNPLLSGTQGSHTYSPFQLQQQQHYRSPMSPHLHTPYQHTVSNSTNIPSPGGAMYGGSVASQNAVHLHPGTHSFSPQSLNGFQKLMEMGTEPERRGWLEHYIRFMEEIGKPLVGLPQVVKQPLDLYRFYLAVRERGGVLEVIKARRWKEISQLVNINASASAAYTLRKNYCKFLLDYECRFDRGGADPRPLLSLIDAMSGKKKKMSSGDNESSCGHSASLSGASVQTPAPPSPAGSHSSASSSLLPPGSGSASLSGVPTVGSAASDSQMGSSSQHQPRFNESGQPLNASLVMEGNNGTSGSPASCAVSTGSLMSGPNAPSPRRPPSVPTAINGFPNTSHNTSETTIRQHTSWPWSSEGGLNVTSASTQSSPMAVNGFSSSSVRGPLAAHAMQSPFDHGVRSQYVAPVPMNKNVIPNASSTENLLTSSPITTNSTILTSTCASGLSPSSPSVTTVGQGFPAMFSNGPEPTVHHHPGSCSIASGSTYTSGLPSHTNMSHQLQSAHHNLYSSAGAIASQPPLPSRLGSSVGLRQPTLTLQNAGPPGSSTADQVALLCMHSRLPVPTVASSCPPGVPPLFSGCTSSSGSGVPAHLVHHHGQRSGYVTTILKRVEHCPFPPGTIEATQPEPTRRRRYRAKDISTLAPSKLLMALRSGLTAEVSWALNCLNILLRDDSGVEYLTPSTMPTLITNLVEIWRHSLGEMFDHELFVTSLELPTDLSAFSTTSPNDKHSERSSSRQLPLHPSSNRKMSPPSLSRVKHLDSLISPNGLVNLERDIIALAAVRNVPLSSLRNGIRRLLRKCSDSSVHTFSVRARNGLIMRIDSRNNATSVCNTVPITCAPSDSTTVFGSRHKKKTRLIPGPTYSAIPSNLLSASPASANWTVPDSSGVSIQSIPYKTDSSNVCMSTARVSTTAADLRSPQTCSNLRELALCVIDELSKSDPDSDSCSGRGNHPPMARKNLGIKGANSKTGHQISSAEYLRELFMHGGGDTTCHIMPPFGAFAFPSSHWSGNSVSPATFLKRRPSDPSSTPPPTVVREKCASMDELVGDHEESSSFTDDYDGQPSNKRARHVSTSSLSCPILSPQPIDELADPSSSSVSGTQSATASTFKREDSDQEHCREQNDDEDDEFAQLVVDANGQCPLRAREELVQHGSTCLWPNSAEADSNEARAVRCLCVSTVLRNLSFLTVAESHLSCHKGTLSLIGRVLLLGHDHVGPLDTWQTVEMAAQAMEASLCAWRTPTWLEDMRENALVLLVNIAGYLNLINFEESIVRPVLEGLVHWITCSTALSIDPFPGHRTLSPRRLALEAVNRLCVHESNVDLLLSTSKPNQSDLSKLFDRLAHWLALPEDQVTRELALSTMHYLTGGGVSVNHSPDVVPNKTSISDQSTAFSLPSNFVGTTMLALAKPCPIAGLLAFIEAAEATTRRVIEQFGVQALQERPELMGTSLEMVRRAGALLDRLAADPTGRSRFTPNLELRLLDLVTSRVLDATVAHLLCGALHRLSPTKPLNSETVTPLVPPTPSLLSIAELLNSARSELENSSTTENNSKRVTQTNTSSPNPSLDTVASPGPNENGPCSTTTQEHAVSPSNSNSNSVEKNDVAEELISPSDLTGNRLHSATDRVIGMQPQLNDQMDDKSVDSAIEGSEPKLPLSVVEMSTNRNCVDS